MAEPRISICLPLLNGRRFLEARLAGIQAQTLTDWELIVCDSHSDDGSWEWLKRYADDRNIRLYQVPREGLYAGWNECLRRARGEFVHIAAADDLIEPEFLEALVSEMERHEDVSLAVCRFDFVDLEGGVIAPDPRQRLDRVYDRWRDVPHRRPHELDLLIHFCIGIPWITAGSLVFRRSLLKKTGLFRTDCFHDADRFWSLRASLHSDTISLPECLASWRYHPDQASQFHDRNWARRGLRLMRNVLVDCEDRIPLGWKSDPLWRDRLLWKSKQHVRAEYCLDRRSLLRSPHRLLLGGLRALVSEPDYLRRRLSCGLSWDVPEFADEHDYLWDLVRRWNVQWEPIPLGYDRVGAGDK